MTKIQTLLCLTMAIALCWGCQGDPLDQKYQKDEDGSGLAMKPLFDEDGKSIVDTVSLSYFVNAEVENKIHGIANEQFTYRELIEQGRQLSNQKKVDLYDSLGKQGGAKP